VDGGKRKHSDDLLLPFSALSYFFNFTGNVRRWLEKYTKNLFAYLLDGIRKEDLTRMKKSWAFYYFQMSVIAVHRGGGKSLELCAVFPTKDFNQQSWDTFETSKFSGEVSSVDTVSTRYQPVKNNSKGKKVLNF
jgi:hypothetical protein